MKKILDTFFGSKVKIFLSLCAAILILQLFPYLLVGESWGMLHYFMIAPVLELLESCGKYFLVFCASVISSCFLALLLTGLVFLFRFPARKIKSQQEKGSEKTEQ